MATANRNRQALHVGQRIMLKANRAEGWPAQSAQVMGLEGNGTIMVYVKPEDADDDGIREITVDQIAGRATRRNRR